MTNMQYLQIRMFLQQDITRTQNRSLKQGMLIGAITLLVVCIRIFKTPGTGEEILEFIIGIGCLFTIMMLAFSLRKEPYQKRRREVLDECYSKGTNTETALQKIDKVTSISVIAEALSDIKEKKKNSGNE